MARQTKRNSRKTRKSRKNRNRKVGGCPTYCFDCPDCGAKCGMCYDGHQSVYCSTCGSRGSK